MHPDTDRTLLVTRELFGLVWRVDRKDKEQCFEFDSFHGHLWWLFNGNVGLKFHSESHSVFGHLSRRLRVAQSNHLHPVSPPVLPPNAKQQVVIDVWRSGVRLGTEKKRTW